MGSNILVAQTDGAGAEVLAHQISRVWEGLGPSIQI